MLLKLYVCQIFIRLRHECALKAQAVWLTPPPSPPAQVRPLHPAPTLATPAKLVLPGAGEEGDDGYDDDSRARVGQGRLKGAGTGAGMATRGRRKERGGGFSVRFADA